MPLTKDQILAEARALDPKSLRELIEDLRQLVHEDDFTPEQMAEVRRRLERLDRGDTKLIPGDQVMRDLRERLARK